MRLRLCWQGKATVRSMTRSALQVARDALAAGEAALAPHSGRHSRRDYTQPQLFALLVPRQFLRSDCRGVVALAAERRELRQALGLGKVPHYSTLARGAPRLPAGAERMARPVGKRDRRSGVGSMRQRIRSQGVALARMELRASRAP